MTAVLSVLGISPYREKIEHAWQTIRLDIILIVVFTLVHSGGSAGFCSPPSSRRWVRPALFVFAAFLAVSYAFTFSSLLAWLRIPTRIGSILGAGSLTYFMTLTGVLGDLPGSSLACARFCTPT